MNVASASASALSGMRANLTRMNESAARLAGQTADPVTELVDQMQIKTGFEANLTVLDTANDMVRSTIRLWA